MYEKLFIATPTHICKRYCATEFVRGVLDSAPGCTFAIANNSRGNPKRFYDVEILKSPTVVKYLYYNLDLPDDFYGQADSIHRRIVYTVNYLRTIFLETDCTQFLSLESDVLLNPEALKQMMLIREMFPVIHANCYEGFHKQLHGGLIDRITLGCTLIDRSVIEKIDFRYDPGILPAFHDAFFAHDCIANNIPMFYVPQAKVKHMHNSSGGRGWEQIPSSEKS